MNKTTTQDAIEGLSSIIDNIEKKEGHSGYLLEKLTTLKMDLLDEFFTLSKPAPKKQKPKKSKIASAPAKASDQI